MGPELSLTLIDGGRGSSGPGWVLALTSRDRKGARLFLQHFWQTRSFAGTDLQVGTYRGIGLISGRAAVLGRPAQTLATALIDDDLLLLGSGRGVLEQALDVSQLDTQNQLGDQQLQGQPIGGPGLACYIPPRSQDPLQVPAAVADRRDLAGLVAALKPHGLICTWMAVAFRGPSPGTGPSVISRRSRGACGLDGAVAGFCAVDGSG